jgi:hypothetical protein
LTRFRSKERLCRLQVGGIGKRHFDHWIANALILSKDFVSFYLRLAGLQVVSVVVVVVVVVVLVVVLLGGGKLINRTQY